MDGDGINIQLTFTSERFGKLAVANKHKNLLFVLLNVCQFICSDFPQIRTYGMLLFNVQAFLPHSHQIYHFSVNKQKISCNFI